MRNIFTIAMKELKTYFTSPMAYIITAVFLAMSGFFYAQDLASAQLARLHGFFGPASFLLVLIGPLLTMRLLAEEQKLGTLELLLTAPVRDYEVVIGKFVAVLGILFVMLAITFYYPLLLVINSSPPDWGPVLSGYLGLFLLSGCFLALGLFASSLTSNQIVAAVVGIGLALLFWLIDSAAALVQNVAIFRDVVTYLSLNAHYTDFVRGVIDTTGLVYYMSFIGVFIFFAVRSLETRRWR